MTFEGPQERLAGVVKDLAHGYMESLLRMRVYTMAWNPTRDFELLQRLASSC